MITRTQGTQLFISIFFLSLAWSIGKRGSQTSVSFEERSRMAFSFSLPSMSEYLGTTGISLPRVLILIDRKIYQREI